MTAFPTNRRSLRRTALFSTLLAISCVHPEQLVELRHATAGGVDVRLLAPTDALKNTRNYCTLEFRTGIDGHLVDVANVKVTTSMMMEGAPMEGYVTEPKKIDTGRYEVQMVLAMTGTWQIRIDFDDTNAHRTVAFSAVVQ